ncbi:MAG TPA: helix-turn-helix domain-containing protein [Candidatus Norongarragalinales archaeon]|nr:helix-turn-helix domain-containing protein [Candidatus Norongarragalinales archaeon]
MEQLKVKIAGEISLSSDPGSTMKKWREVFNIQQTELSQYLKISPSTISDYESNRRKSPGIAVIHRFVDALFALDSQKGGTTIKKFREADESGRDMYEAVEFIKPVGAKEFAKLIEAKVLANGEKLETKSIFGCTILDSVRVILELPYESFIKIYSTTSERALIFTHVSTGRSPMIAVRVTPIKPSLIILHGIEEVDKLAVKIAETEGIPLLVTKLGIEEIKKRVKDIAY